MSTPDSRLSAAERAALAELAAAAAAADPSLAALLRGGTARRIRSNVRQLRIALTKAAVAVLGSRWWGVPITAAGVLLMVLGLGTAIPLSFFGALVAAVGLGVLAHMARARMTRAATSGQDAAG